MTDRSIAELRDRERRLVEKLTHVRAEIARHTAKAEAKEPVKAAPHKATAKRSGTQGHVEKW